MPIEVRELVIRARVDEVTADAGPAAGNNSKAATLSERELQKIIARCAEEVLKVLQRQKER